MNEYEKEDRCLHELEGQLDVVCGVHISNNLLQPKHSHQLQHRQQLHLLGHVA